jgi:hypothetical protein
MHPGREVLVPVAHKHVLFSLKRVVAHVLKRLAGTLPLGIIRWKTVTTPDNLATLAQVRNLQKKLQIGLYISKI